jgi:alpha-glucosidase
MVERKGIVQAKPLLPLKQEHLQVSSMEEWWRGAVIYQIYPRSFQDGNGDGVGDLPGALARLDHLAALGVDAVWIAPFFRSPMKDAGYDVADHCAVDSIFGRIEDFDALLARAHTLGIKVLIDMVWGHTSDRHPWFLASRSAREGSQADWYVWADPKPDGGPPNNWLSIFGGGAWTWEPRRRQYYLHHFLAAQPTLNLRNPAVLDALLAIGRFWLERGVDGFRLDAVDFYLHDPDLEDNPPRPLEGDVPAKPFGMQIHLNDGPQPELLSLFARIRALLDEFPGSASIAELSSLPDPLRRAALYTGANGGRLHMAYTLGLMRRDFSAEALIHSISEAEMAFAADGWLCWAFSNHDIERVASRWGDGSPAFAKLALALLFSLRGSVCLYQGEELGLTEAKLDLAQLRDPFGIAFWPDYKGRDGCRTPFPWRADAPHAGFSEAEPWLPIPPEHLSLAADRQETDAGSVLAFARRMLAWRKSRAEMRDGTLKLVDLGKRLVAFERRSGTQRTLCLFNPGPEPAPLPRLDGWHWIDPAGLQRPEGRLPGWGAAFYEDLRRV